jgi:hypothetical protein
MAKKIILLVFLLASLACKKSETNAFAGNWSGQFSGTDNGTWNINISNNGTVSGTGYSNVLRSNFKIEGRVNDAGNLLAAFGTTSLDGRFDGSLRGSSATGNWSNGSYSGTWSGSKP